MLTGERCLTLIGSVLELSWTVARQIAADNAPCTVVFSARALPANRSTVPESSVRQIKRVRRADNGSC